MTRIIPVLLQNAGGTSGHVSGPYPPLDSAAHQVKIYVGERRLTILPACATQTSQSTIRRLLQPASRAKILVERKVSWESVCGKKGELGVRGKKGELGAG